LRSSAPVQAAGKPVAAPGTDIDRYARPDFRRFVAPVTRPT